MYGISLRKSGPDCSAGTYFDGNPYTHRLSEGLAAAKGQISSKRCMTSNGAITYLRRFTIPQQPFSSRHVHIAADSTLSPCRDEQGPFLCPGPQPGPKPGPQLGKAAWLWRVAPTCRHDATAPDK